MQFPEAHSSTHQYLVHEAFFDVMATGFVLLFSLQALHRVNYCRFDELGTYSKQ
jgi:hypothetical protein